MTGRERMQQDFYDPAAHSGQAKAIGGAVGIEIASPKNKS
jgi:hypothetical protein